MKTEQEIFELEKWIWLNVFGWIEWREEEFPYRAGYSQGDEYGVKCLECDMCHPVTDPADAFAVLQRCVERVTKDISINSDGKTFKVFSIMDWSGQTEAWWEEDESLPVAICLYAKKLFTAK